MPTLDCHDGTSAVDDIEKATLLNECFVRNVNSICTGNVERTPVQPSVIESCPVEFLCTEEDVYHLLATIDTSKSSGHDDISGRMLKVTALSITPVITELFNQSIILGKLPDEWKVARVCPVPKSGKSSNPNNYRPISLLSILSKLLEKHIRNILVKHFEDKHPLSAQQWGFHQVNQQLVHCYLLLNIGIGNWKEGMIFVQFSLTLAKPLIQSLMASCLRSCITMMYIQSSSAG